MSVLAIIQLALAGLQSVVGALAPGGAIATVVGEAIAAINNVINNQSATPETLAELESLRAKKLW
ncbi:MAG TPA: hypothetical protein VN785_12365 [Candidatus Angelobacter sp.]|nr:hypothetical protein [Candidatus Angelobacter sp.]